MTTISINQKGGITGRNIQIGNNKIMIDGVDYTNTAGENKVINITVTGNLDNIEGDFNTLTVTGDTGPVKTQNGDIKVGGNIKGTASTMNGSIDCDGNIEGDATTMNGSIKYRKS